MNSKLNARPPSKNNYTCFMVDGQQYAVASDQVIEVHKVPGVRRVPRAPSFIRGVANVRGEIIPILNTRERFGLEHFSTDKELLLVARVNDVRYGLLIDSVTRVLAISEKDIAPVNPVLVDSGFPFVSGMATPEGRIIHLLDLEVLIYAGLSLDPEKRKAYREYATRSQKVQSRRETVPTRRFLVFQIGRERWGLAVDWLEQVFSADRLLPVSGGPGFLAGMLRRRNRMVPVIDFRKKWGRDAPAAQNPPTDPVVPDRPEPRMKRENRRILIARTSPAALGILVDRANELVDIPENKLKTPPSAVVGPRNAHIGKVAFLDGGARLVMLIDETRLFSENELEKLFEIEGMDKIELERDGKKQSRASGNSYLLFQVADHEFALPLNILLRVIDYRHPNRVPKAPARMRGLLPVRGELVSLIDLRKALDLEPPTAQHEKRIVIMRGDSTPCGIIVDKVKEIISVEQEQLVAPPEIMDGIDSGWVEKIIRADQGERTPILLKLEKVIV